MSVSITTFSSIMILRTMTLSTTTLSTIKISIATLNTIFSTMTLRVMTLSTTLNNIQHDPRVSMFRLSRCLCHGNVFVLIFCNGKACGAIILQWPLAQLFPAAWTSGMGQHNNTQHWLPICCVSHMLSVAFLYYYAGFRYAVCHVCLVLHFYIIMLVFIMLGVTYA